MAKKRKPTFRERAIAQLKAMDALKYDEEADFDAIQRAQSQLAIAASLRKPVKRKKTLDQQIVDAEKKAVAKEAKDKLEEARLKKQRAAAKKRRDAERAKA